MPQIQRTTVYFLTFASNIQFYCVTETWPAKFYPFTFDQIHVLV